MMNNCNKKKNKNNNIGVGYLQKKTVLPRGPLIRKHSQWLGK